MSLDSDDEPMALNMAAIADDASDVSDTSADSESNADDCVADGDVMPMDAVTTAREKTAADAVPEKVGKKRLPTAKKEPAAKAKTTAGDASTGTKKPKIAKKEKLTQDDVTDIVARWFARENRPAIAVSLFAALGSKVSKTLIQRALDDLVTRGVVLIKDIKKAAVYYPQQAQFVALSDDQAAELKSRCDQATLRLAQLDADHRELSAARASLGSSAPSLDALRAELAQADATVRGLRLRVSPTDEMPQQEITISRSDMTAAVQRFQQMKALRQKRQRLALDIIEAFATDRRPSEFIDELGLETDSPAVLIAIEQARVPAGMKKPST